jgi:hypothetical protein
VAVKNVSEQSALPQPWIRLLLELTNIYSQFLRISSLAHGLVKVGGQKYPPITNEHGVGAIRASTVTLRTQRTYLKDIRETFVSMHSCLKDYDYAQECVSFVMLRCHQRVHLFGDVVEDAVSLLTDKFTPETPHSPITSYRVGNTLTSHAIMAG